jgi:flagellar assembly protein FliH
MSPLPIPDRSRRLIKAHAARRLDAGEMFNVDDLQHKCDELVEEAHRRAAEILAHAREQAAQICANACSEGHAAGRQAALESAAEFVEARAAELATIEARERLESLVPALEQVAQSLDAERERWLAEWESHAIRLSVAIAERVARCKLAEGSEAIGTLVRELLQLAAASPRIEVRLNPRDLETLSAGGQDVAASLSRVGETTFTGDECIARGGCIVETRHGAIDARIETQITRIAHELLSPC